MSFTQKQRSNDELIFEAAKKCYLFSRICERFGKTEAKRYVGNADSISSASCYGILYRSY